MITELVQDAPLVNKLIDSSFRRIFVALMLKLLHTELFYNNVHAPVHPQVARTVTATTEMNWLGSNLFRGNFLQSVFMGTPGSFLGWTFVLLLCTWPFTSRTVLTNQCLLQILCLCPGWPWPCRTFFSMGKTRSPWSTRVCMTCSASCWIRLWRSADLACFASSFLYVFFSAFFFSPWICAVGHPHSWLRKYFHVIFFQALHAATTSTGDIKLLISLIINVKFFLRKCRMVLGVLIFWSESGPLLNAWKPTTWIKICHLETKRTQLFTEYRIVQQIDVWLATGLIS